MLFACGSDATGRFSRSGAPPTAVWYPDAEVERLSLLQRATNAGHSIGHIARLSGVQLAELFQADQADQPAANRFAPNSDVVMGRAEAVIEAEGTESTAPDSFHLDRCLKAIEDLVPGALDAALGRAAVALGQGAVLDRVVAPLVGEVGERWRRGVLRIAQEHLATAVIRTFLAGIMQRARVDEQAPNLVVATPTGQLHEIGALLAAAAAATEGWRVTYLGSNLPSEEIAATALHSGARAIALSIVFPDDDLRLPQEVAQLRPLFAQQR